MSDNIRWARISDWDFDAFSLNSFQPPFRCRIACGLWDCGACFFSPGAFLTAL